MSSWIVPLVGGAYLNKNKDKQVLAPSKWFSYEDKQYILNLFLKNGR